MEYRLNSNYDLSLRATTVLWILAVMFKTAKAPFPRVILSEGRNTVQTEVETRRATTKWSDLAAIR